MACWGFDFLPHLVVLQAGLTFPSSDDWRVLTALALVALNSSTTDETGRGSLEVLLYKLTALKDGGTPSHFRKNLLHSLSIPSTWDMGNS